MIMVLLTVKYPFKICKYLNAMIFLEFFSTLLCQQCKDCTNYWSFENNFVDQKHSPLELFNYQNVSFTNDRNGKEKSALYLNNGYIQINSSSVSWTGDFTITAWVYPKGRVACGKLLDCGIKGQNEIVINLSSCNGDGLALQIYNNRSVSQFVYNRKRLEANMWQHVAFTLKDGKILIYTNGIIVATSTTNLKPNIPANYGTCFIGKSLWINNPNIDAYIDDLSMFSTGLSADEIGMTMYKPTTTTTTTTTKTKTRTTTTKSSTILASKTSSSIRTDSLISTSTSTTECTPTTLPDSWASAMTNWWAWNSNLVLDSVTCLNNTPINGGGTLVPDRNGTPNSAIYIAGSEGKFDTGYFRLPSAVYFSGSAGYIITVWVFPKAFAYWSRIIDCASSNDRPISNNVLLAITSGTTGSLSFVVYDSGPINIDTEGTIFSLETWHHLDATVEASAGRTTTTARLYQNNVLIQTNTQVPVTPTVLRNDSYIGFRPFSLIESSAIDQLLNVYLDDLRIFNRLLTTEELTSIYELYV